MEAAAIEREAIEELSAEIHREAVDAAKVRIRERNARPWWRRLFPFTIEIKRTS